MLRPRKKPKSPRYTRWYGTSRVYKTREGEYISWAGDVYNINRLSGDYVLDAVIIGINADATIHYTKLAGFLYFDD